MRAQQLRWVRGVGVMVGSIVGAGVFGLPYAFQQSGITIGLIQLGIVGLVMMVLFLMYAEITVQTKGKHRFVSYMVKFLGPKAKWIATVLFFGSVIGGLLAYVILGGSFLADVVYFVTGNDLPGGRVLGSLIVTAFAGIFIYKGLGFISKIDVWLVGGVLLLYGILIVVSLPVLDVANLEPVNRTIKDSLLPIGVVLFALGGLGAVPEVHDVLRLHKPLPSALVAGMIIIVGLYALFSFAIVGATGPETTQDVMSGLANVLDPRITILGTILGLVSIVSIFIHLGLITMDTLELDFEISRFQAWSITLGVPVALFFIGAREFITVLGFFGTFFGGSLGILVVVAYEKLKQHPKCKKDGHACWYVPSWISYLVIAVFVVGMVANILYSVL